MAADIVLWRLLLFLKERERGRLLGFISFFLSYFLGLWHKGMKSNLYSLASKMLS